MVWGFTEILVAPLSLMAISLSSVMVSARPASTVYSRILEMSMFLAIACIIFSISCAESDVGVPPPIYTVSQKVFLSRRIFPVSSISRQSISTYRGISSFAPFDCIEWETNEQYEHLDGQNGIDT